MGRNLIPQCGQVILVSGYPVLTAVNWSQHWCPICVHYQFSCASKLARKCGIEHWSRSSKPINWSADSFQINHVTSMSWDISPQYGHVTLAILFWQLSIDHIMNVQYKRCGLPKTRQRHPSLPFDSLPYPPVQSVDACAWSITRQPNKKRSIIFYVYGALSHARGARVGALL